MKKLTAETEEETKNVCYLKHNQKKNRTFLTPILALN